jgi:hypothetical protein
MKIKYLSTFAILIFTYLLLIKAETNQQKENSSEEWLQAIYKEATSIHKGMTRAELLEKYKIDGGIQRIPESRFILKACSLIKIEVEFDTPYGPMRLS